MKKYTPFQGEQKTLPPTLKHEMVKPRLKHQRLTKRQTKIIQKLLNN